MRFFPKEKKAIQPHLWFAWFPVYTCKEYSASNSPWGYVWLEYVLRFKYKNGGDWRYRLSADDLPRNL